MTARTFNTVIAGRSSSMRRLRRRADHPQRPYCRTNGCASFLDVDAGSHRAVCQICGYTRRLD
jgi:hypothetical protein